MSAVPCIDPLEVVSRLYWAEGDDLELKSARGGLPHSLWETYSAMANSQGGVILLGVEDDGRVSGIADPPRLKKGFWDTINNRGKVNVNLLGPGDLVELTEGSATLLVTRVPPDCWRSCGGHNAPPARADGARCPPPGSDGEPDAGSPA